MLTKQQACLHQYLAETDNLDQTEGMLLLLHYSSNVSDD